VRTLRLIQKAIKQLAVPEALWKTVALLNHRNFMGIAPTPPKKNIIFFI
jgi:hypothetical protein